LARGIEIARQFGDWLRWGEIMMVYTAAHHRHGEFERAAGLAAELLASGRRRSNVLHQAWGLGAQGDALLRLGTLAESVQMLEAACELFPQTADRISEINATGVLVQAYVRSGDLAKARSTAEKTAHLVATARPTSDYVLEGFAGLAELALVDWDSASTENAQKLRRAARKACGAFLKLMRVHSRTRPRAWLCWGQYEWLAGMRAAAIASWQKSLAAAESLDMPYEAALTCFEWGRHSNGKVREQHLAKALQLFERLGCQYDAAQVRAVSES
jgi:tetratricopeptide (TPR) repeat protein